MAQVARYILPQHAALRGPHTREELYLLVHRGSMGRGEIVYDQTTKRAHRVGDLIEGMSPPTARSQRPTYRELEGDAPWTEPSSSHRPPPPPAPRFTPEDEPDFEGHFAPAPPHDEEAAELDSLAFGFPGPQTQEEDQPEDEPEDSDDEPLEEEETDEEDVEEEAQALPIGPRRFYLGHPTWLAYTRWLLLCVVCVAAGVLSIEHFSLLGPIVGGGLASLLLCGCIIDRMHQDYIISSERVEMVWGIFGRSSKEVRIADIRSIDVIQSGFLGLLGIGTVEFSSSGSDGVEVHFKNVRSPHKIKEVVRKLQKIAQH
jgi:hypothetical protein